MKRLSSSPQSSEPVEGASRFTQLLSKSQALHREVNQLSDYMCSAPTGRHIEGLSFNCSAAQQFGVKLKIPTSSISSALLAFVSACRPYLRVPPTHVSLCLAPCRAPSWSTTAPGLWGVITPHQTESSTTSTSCWHPTLWRIGRLSRLTGCAEFDWDQKKSPIINQTLLTGSVTSSLSFLFRWTWLKRLRS